MLGLAEASSGQAEVLGRSSANRAKIRQRVGYVPERPTLYEWMTVEEIGWFTAGFYGAGSCPSIHGWPPGSGCRRKKSCSALQGHARQGGARAGPGAPAGVADSRRAHLGPDSHGAARVPGKHGRSGRAGKTVFLSSHQIVEVERVADIVAILRKGKLLLVEPLDELKAQVRRLTVTVKDGVTALPEFRRRCPLAAAESPAVAIACAGSASSSLRRCGAGKASKTWRSMRRAWKIFSSPT